MNLVDSHITDVNSLCKQHNVSELYLFGSVLRADFSEESDIDFAVDFFDESPIEYAKNYFNLKFSLQELFKKSVDLLEIRALNNPYFLENFNSTKKLIYGAKH